MAKNGNRPLLTLRGRLVGSMAILSALGLFGAGAAGLVMERENVEARIQDTLAREVREFSELARTGVDPETGEAFANPERLISTLLQRNIPDEHEATIGFVSDATLAPAGMAGQLHNDPVFRREVLVFQHPGFGEFDSPTDGRIVYAVMPITTSGPRAHYVAAYFIDLELAELHDTIRSYAVAAVVAWLVLVGASWLTARRILRPIHDLRTTAAQITDTDTSRRIDIQGNDEVADLGSQFNEMLDRLEDALGAQRRMLDDAGHELRTPITVIRGHLELMDADDPADVQQTRTLAMDELDRMGGLVQDLLVLAKARRPDFLNRRATDVDELVTDALTKARALSDDRVWVVDAAPPGTALLDRNRITQALLQLATNAVTATGPGDTIGFGCSHSAGMVRLWVRDTGPGVPPAERQRIFARYTSQPGGNGDGKGVSAGTGLGLAIVTAIAQAHGGTAWVTAAEQGGGARFIIDLPHGLGAGAEPSATAPTAPAEEVTA